jgi:hypothetical protein
MMKFAWIPILILALVFSLAPTMIVLWSAQIFHSLSGVNIVSGSQLFQWFLVALQCATGAVFVGAASLMSLDTRHRSAVVIGIAGPILLAVIYLFAWSWLIYKLLVVIGFVLAVVATISMSHRLHVGKMRIKTFKGE